MGTVQYIPNPALDPGAPVFVPRTRFGSTRRSSTGLPIAASVELQRAALHSVHSTSNLRVRSPSEQNIDNPVNNRQPAERAQGYQDARGSRAHRNRVQPRHQRRSRTTDQDATIPETIPHREIHHLSRPQPSFVSQRHATTVVRTGPNSASPSLRQPSTFAQADTIRRTGQWPSQMDLEMASGNNVTSFQAFQTRSVSPAISTRSRSTPNLLQLPAVIPHSDSRSSSLSWRSTSRAPRLHRIPSMVSAASGISGGASRQSSREGLDAAAEFLRMRNSPLDDLTEKFSRLSADRSRSVGRS